MLVHRKKNDIKLADFGVACKIPETGKMSVVCGSLGYFAPEVMMKHPYTELVDMFSLGVVCYAVLAGFQPFYGETDREIIKANLEVEYDFENDPWGFVSDQGNPSLIFLSPTINFTFHLLLAKDFITKLLERKPEDRLSAKEALTHPWLQPKFSSN